MALEKQVISINFAQGLDQKTDDKLTSKLLTADNAVLRKNGTIEKRLGFVSAGMWSLSANPVKIFPFRDGHIAVTDYATDSIAAMGTTDSAALGVQHVAVNVNGTWIAQEFFAGATIQTQPLVYDSNDVIDCDVAAMGFSGTSGLIAAGYQDAIHSVNLRFLDVLTGTSKQMRGIQYSGSATTSQRLVSLTNTSNTVTSLYFSGTSLVFDVFNNQSDTLVTRSSINGCETINAQLDAIPFNNKIYFVTKQVSTTGLIVGWFDPSNSTTSTTVIPGSVTADVLTLATPAPGTDRVRLVWTNNTAFTSYQAAYSATLSQILAPTAFAAGATGVGPIIQLGACENVGATVLSVVFTQSSTVWSSTFSGWSGDFSNTATLIAGTKSDTSSVGMGWVGCVLSAKPFLAHGQPHAIFNFNQTGQQSVFLGRRLPASVSTAAGIMPIARCLYGLAGPNNSASYALLPTVVGSDAETFWTTNRRAVFFSSLNGNLTVNYAFELLKINFSQSAPIPFARIADSLYCGGGFLQEFDGLGFIESGFLSSPSIFSASTLTTGGSLTSGVYSFIACKEYTDQAGFTFRGKPSIPITITTSTTTSKINFRVFDGPNFRDSSPGRSQFQTRMAIFRTQGNGSIYYRDLTNAVQFNRAVPGNLFSLTSADAAISSGDVIYTQGGSLANFTPDGVVALCAHGARLFCNDGSDNSILRYSKEKVQGEGISFAIENVIKIPHGNGKVTALASLDSILVVFRNRQIIIVNGNGPDDTGLNGAFSDGQLLFPDVGCIDQRSLVRFRDGIIFKSQDKGFYALTRDLQLQYIGADVEDYNSKIIVSSEVVGLAETDGAAEECRFLCSDGTLLTHNYFSGQWTTGTLAGCRDAIQNNGTYVVANTSTTATNARIFQQSLSTYTDDFLAPASVTYGMTIETAWIKTADVQGFQRIYKAIGIGKAQGPGQITVEVGYDYETAYAETHTAIMSSLTAASYTGGQAAVPQFNLTPARQRCQAIRFRIKDIPAAGNTSGVFRLTNLSLECGVKKGGFLLPPSKGI